MRLNRYVVALLAGVLCAASGCTSSAGEASDDPQPAGHTHAGDGSSATLLVGDGTRAVEVGYRLADVRMPSRAGEPGRVSFKIKRYDGSTVRDYKSSRRRSCTCTSYADLAVFRHLHPTMSQDGTWSAALTLPTPGDYRVVAQFVARDEGGNGDHLMLGSTKTVPGTWTREPLPRTRDGDDGTIEVAARGTVAVGNDGRLDLEVRNSSGGPVDLGSYLGSSAHVTGFRERTGAAAHMHPLGQPSVGRGGDPAGFPHRVRGARRLPTLRAGAGGRLPAHGAGHGHRPLRGTRKLSEATGFSNSSMRRLTWTRQVPSVGSTTSAR